MLDGIRHTAIVFPFQYKDVNSNIDYMTSASQKNPSRLRWVISPTIFLLEVSLVSRRLCNTNHISLYYLRQKEMLCLFVISDPSIWHEMIYLFILASTIKTLLSFSWSLLFKIDHWRRMWHGLDNWKEIVLSLFSS